MSEEPWLPLHHLVVARPAPISWSSAPAVEFDASPWGCGAVLRNRGAPEAHFAIPWTKSDAEAIDARIGEPAGQTTFEYLTLFLVLVVFGTEFRGEGLIILGDNIGALENALNLKGKRALSRISREIAWRRARRGWRYVCGHLPAEQNVTADCLSRLSVPGPNAKTFPPEVQGARRVIVPKVSDLCTRGL